MVDKRVEKFAKVLVDYSMCVKKGEYVKIRGTTEAKPLILELYKAVLKKGAYPLLDVEFPELNYIYYKNASEEQLKTFPQLKMDELKKVQVYFGIISPKNTRDLSKINPKIVGLRNKVTRPISDYIVNGRPNIRRCTTCYPTVALAQEAEMSIQEYEDFVFSAVNIDWKKEKERLKKINTAFEKGSEVRIIGKETDIKLSIKGKNSVADYGEENMPGGEVFMAPVRESLNGHIKFTYPAIYMGREVSDIYLEFKNGKVVNYDASKNKDTLKIVLNTDKNSSYVGELGIGCNPKITKFTKELLLDEKIHGTVHLALGMAYKQNGGGNDSAVHWDIVKELRDGGEIILDGKVIQKNGKWLI